MLLLGTLTEILLNEDTVRDRTVLSGELKQFCSLIWHRITTTRTLSETEQSCLENWSTFICLPDREPPLRGHCPRRNSPVWRIEALLSAYLTEVLHNEDVVRFETVLSGELKRFCPFTWQRFFTTRSSPGRNCPAWRTESFLSAYLTEVLHYEYAVRDRSVLSWELKHFCPITWQRFSTTRTLSGTEQSCLEHGIPFVSLPDRGFLLRGHCPRRHSPVRRNGPLTWQRFSTTRTLSGTEQSCPANWSTFVRLPDRGSPLRGHCPGRNSPVRSTESPMSAYLTEVLHYQDAVRDGTVLSGEGDSGPVQVRRTEGHVGRAVVVNQLDCDLKKKLC